MKSSRKKAKLGHLRDRPDCLFLSADLDCTAVGELIQQARPTLHIDAAVARIVRWRFLVVGALRQAEAGIAVSTATDVTKLRKT